MTDKEIKDNIDKFCADFENCEGKENAETQSFWLKLLEALGATDAHKLINFEKTVMIDGKAKRIDCYIPTTKVLIEQKSKGVNLLSERENSGNIKLSAFEQAKRYADYMKFSEKPRYIITCNFTEFHIYDLENVTEPCKVIYFSELKQKYLSFKILFDANAELIDDEKELSFKAGKIVAKLYDLIAPRFCGDKEKDDVSLNVLCVRLVFCLYAEDALVFPYRNQFHDYIKNTDANHLREALIELFAVLDQKEEERDKYLREELKRFPYVNGGLFAKMDVEIPTLTEEIRQILIREASEEFDWSNISPTIFGSLFESTLNHETRRKGGMHYTSVENIHKLIDVLFLDELKKELDNIMYSSKANKKEILIKEFQKKISSLTFFDPACGSGNFLTETYISLRKLELRALEFLMGEQIGMNSQDFHPIMVNLNQFYGIEINDFAVTVAKTALWIAESQMMIKTAKILHKNLDFLPIKSYANIEEGNSLHIDWHDVCADADYIIGNPPFVGARMMDMAQKNDLIEASHNAKNAGNLDYVTAWFFKATDYMKESVNTKTALVATNSICQGEQVALLWKPLFNENIHINFAYRTFKWDNSFEFEEGKRQKADTKMAAVHVIIVGFSLFNNNDKVIYDGDLAIKAKNINGYLIDASDIVIESRKKSLCDIVQMNFGSMPNDDGNLILNKEEKDEFIAKYPDSAKFIKQFMGAEEFINNKVRYCLWLKDANPTEIRSCKEILERIENVRNFRLASTREATRKLAEVPMLFGEIRQPDSDYILVPSVSSENRKFIPIGFLPKDVIASNATQIIPNATLSDFAVLTSSVHMAWMRVVAGRLKSDYRYSKDIVYNNFPWCEIDEKAKASLEATAQAILDARAKYINSSLADLYDENSMPVELRKAHKENDKLVLKLYSLDKDEAEETIVKHLFERYEELIRGKK